MRYTFLIAVVFTLFLSTLVTALPEKPNQFYGTVTINGQPAPDGSIVTAKINGAEVASTVTKNGKYGYEPIFYISDTDPPSRSGATINFFVNGIDSGKSASFCNGCVDRLDLSVTQQTTGGNAGGGGGGSGGSHGSGGETGGSSSSSGEEITTTVEEGSQECREKWVCTDWSACVNGKQTRTCHDENNCGTDLYKPFEEQPCVSEQGAQAGGFNFSATGRFLTSPVGIGSLGVVVFLLAGLFVWVKKGKKKK